MNNRSLTMQWWLEHNADGMIHCAEAITHIAENMKRYAKKELDTLALSAARRAILCAKEIMDQAEAARMHITKWQANKKERS